MSWSVEYKKLHEKTQPINLTAKKVSVDNTSYSFHENFKI